MSGSKDKTIAFVAYPGVTLLDLVCTYGGGTLLTKAGYRVTTVAENLDAIETDTPMAILPDKTFEQVPRPDILFVMGGGIATLFAIGDEALMGYVQAAARTASLVVGVSQGALILASAGLLDGQEATTHWAYRGLLERLGARYIQRRWVENGKTITTAGGSAGLDMGLKLVAQLVNRKSAKLMQLFAEYDPHPPFGGIDWVSVDPDALGPMLAGRLLELREALAHRPAVLAAVEAEAGASVLARSN
jgi:transcriptional regulator GlxA family with amidase domain